MRKAIALFAVLIGAFGVIGLAGASPASAAPAHRAVVGATCTPATSAVVYNGYWAWTSNLIYCQAVNAVEFAEVNGSQGYTVYMSCACNPVVHYSFTGGGIVNGVYASYQNWYQNITWGSGCGAPAFNVQKSWSFRIKNANNNTWGAWHTTNSSVEAIC